MPEEKKVNLHEGHRQRMKNRFLKHGLDSFDDYQTLEVLLFYAVPKKDTNELAHVLINTFGSLNKVFEADCEALTKISGIGENAASLIKFFQMMSKRYIASTFSYENVTCFNTPEKLMGFCKNLFLGITKEQVYALALDCELALVDKILLAIGTGNAVGFSYRLLSDFVCKSNCNRLVLTHNHPNGTHLVSRDDVFVTADIVRFLEGIEVELVDHIVVGKDGVSSMRESQYASSVWD